MHAQPSEQAAVIACIDPDAYAAAEYNTKGTANHTIDMAKWHEILILVLVGDIVTNGTINVDVESGSDNSTFANTIKSVTQLTQAGTDSNKQVVINLRSDELPAGDRYVNIESTLGTAGADFALVVLGTRPRYAPASDDDLSTVDEIVT